MRTTISHTLILLACLFTYGCSGSKQEQIDNLPAVPDFPAAFQINTDFDFIASEGEVQISGSTALNVASQVLTIQDILQAIQPNTVLPEMLNFNPLLSEEYPQLVTDSECGEAQDTLVKVDEKQLADSLEETFNKEFISCKRGRFEINGKGLLTTDYTSASETTLYSVAYEDIKINDLLTGEVFAFTGSIQYRHTPGSDYSDSFDGLLTDSSNNQYRVLLNTQLEGAFDGGEAFVNYGGSIGTSHLGEIDIQTRWSTYANFDENPIQLNVSGDQQLKIQLAGSSEIVMDQIELAGQENEQTEAATVRYGSAIPYAFLLLKEFEVSDARPVAMFSVDEASLAANQAAIFDGSLSYDQDYGLLAFNWQVESSSAGALAEIEDSSAQLTEITFLSAGEYTVSLVVDDATNLSEVFSQQFTIE